MLNVIAKMSDINTKHITTLQVEAYTTNKLMQGEQYAFETALNNSNDSFTNDAIDGLMMGNPKATEANVYAIKKQIQKSITPKKRKINPHLLNTTNLAIVIVLLVIVIAVVVINLLA